MWVIPMLALVFCLLGGRNDGSPLVAINLKAARRVTAAPFLMLATAVALLPAANSRVGGTIVAMVSSEGSGGQSPLLLATVLVAASATLLALNGGGVPTSITLALVGASSGAGFAGGHPQWHLVLRVLGVAILSPLVAFAISRTIYLLFQSRTPQSSTTMVFLGFLFTCIAYGSNDGQKMIVLFGTAMGVDLGTATHSAAITAIVAATFLTGVHRHAQGSSRIAARHHRTRFPADLGHPVGGLRRRARQLGAGKPGQHDPVHIGRAHRHLPDERLAQGPLGRGAQDPHRMGGNPAHGLDPGLCRSQRARSAATVMHPRATGAIAPSPPRAGAWDCGAGCGFRSAYCPSIARLSNVAAPRCARG